MSNSFITGSGIVTSDEADQHVKHYTPSVQESAVEEAPEQVDNSPISDADREALDKASEPTFQPRFVDQQNERAETFRPPSDWESPIIKHRRKQQMILPSIKTLDDLDQRIGAVMRFDGAPKQVATLAQEARTAVGAAREAYEAARHPENRRYAVSQAAKDAVIQETAQATTHVAALEKAAREATDKWFGGLVGNLDKQRAAAAKALDEAARAYATWRQTIAAADALAKETGRFGEWHLHPQSRELNPLGLIAELRKARDIAKSDDEWVNGDYLTKEYEGIPPHTLAALERSAEVAGGGSYAQSVFLRLTSVHPADTPAQDALERRDLRIIHTQAIPVLLPEPQD